MSMGEGEKTRPPRRKRIQNNGDTVTNGWHHSDDYSYPKENGVNGSIKNGNAAAVPFPSSAVALPLSDSLRYSRNLAANEDLTLR